MSISFVTINLNRIIFFSSANKSTDLEKCPGLEKSLPQGLIKVKVKPVVGVYVVPYPESLSCSLMLPQ